MEVIETIHCACLRISRQVNIWGSLAIGSRGPVGFFIPGLWGSSTYRPMAGQGDTKKKEREIAKKGIDAALAQFETNPSEALGWTGFMGVP